MRKFEYCAAKDIGDVLEKLQEHGSSAKLLAGGTDLVLALKKKVIAPSHIIGLQKVNELDYVCRENSRVRIGAMTTFSTIAENKIIQEYFPLLSETSGLIGSWQVRNVATIGGNLCTASPAADAAVALSALDAHVMIADGSGETELPLASFFTGPGETALRQDQLLKEIIINLPADRSFGRYLKHMRRKAVDLALVGVAFQAELDSTQQLLKKVYIGLGGVAPTPIRATKAEEVLTGLSHVEAINQLPEAAQKAVETAQPISDVRASADYRRSIVKAYVELAGTQTLDELFCLEDPGK